ncbi:hypothetical protein [Chryseobacterium sp. Mn2064]|uniref:hypothetical protein n=1 Tax=Chryseobacterium sp. Mn2064 TaxID=3395263 RepID=UPI003BE7501E
MDRKITIKHATGDHHLSITNEDFEEYKNLITNCLTGTGAVLTSNNEEDGSIKFFPSEFLKNSVIIFEPSELDKQLQSQAI